MPRNVTRKAPSLPAVTTFLYVAFAETLTVTRSLGQKPVPRTTTGEREVISMRAVRLEVAALAVGSIRNMNERRRANLMRGRYPIRELPTSRYLCGSAIFR